MMKSGHQGREAQAGAAEDHCGAEGEGQPDAATGRGRVMARPKAPLQRGKFKVEDGDSLLLFEFMSQTHVQGTQ
jgi:hypothetical protein